MTVRHRLLLLEQRWPAQVPPPLFVPLPPLLEFRAMTLEKQKQILMGWDPVLDESVNPPWPADLEAMTDEELRRMCAARERAGRDVLLPYVETLPVSDRTELTIAATRLLPASEIWRVQTFRFACRPEWRRRQECQSETTP
jgi:hypothetical protein